MINPREEGINDIQITRRLIDAWRKETFIIVLDLARALFRFVGIYVWRVCDGETLR